MEKQLFSAGFLIMLMVMISVLETIIPGKRDNPLRRGHVGVNTVLTVLTLAVGMGLAALSVLFAVAVGVYDFALVNIEGPYWFVLLTSIFILDFFAYLCHRLMHVFPWLWKVHQIHHSELLVDVTTAYRQHPMEGVWRFLFTVLPAWAFGVPAEVIVVYKTISALWALFEHANISLWKPLDKAISIAFVTPALHKVHHSREAVETDSNYGNITTVFDRALRTFTPSKPLSQIHYGLDEFDRPTSENVFGLMSHPFKQDNHHR